MDAGHYLTQMPLQAEEALARADDVRIVCYENEVPYFAGPEIDRLYGHLFCSLSYFEMARQAEGASTYVAWKNGNPISVLLYTCTAHEVIVINEYASLAEEEIQRFASFMFSAFATVWMISFKKIQTDVRSLDRPCHAIACTEDMVISLPPTVKEYETAVGKNMRRNIKRYTSALEKDFPTWRYRVCLGNEVGEQEIRDIIALSCIRMKSKNIVPRFTEEETQWIVDFAKRCGLVGVMTIDGKVCAGAIGFRIGDNYAMHVIAHDTKYNGYSLGILCYYRTICEGIVRGGKRFHLLQGQYEYKYRLLARRQDIVSLDIYRSQVHAAAYGVRIFRRVWNGRIRLAKQWLLHDIEHCEGGVYRLIGKAVNAIRAVKRSRGSLEGIG